MPDSGDRELVIRAQQGDSDPLGELYNRYHESIYRFILARTASSALAEDLTGEVFLRMLSSLASYQAAQDIPFRAWLYRIARNLLVDHYRKEGRHALESLTETLSSRDSECNPAFAVEHKLTLEEVQKALASLDEMQHEVIVLRFLVGLSLKDVAYALDKSIAAVKAHQHRGLLNLQTALAGKGQ